MLSSAPGTAKASPSRQSRVLDAFGACLTTRLPLIRSDQWCWLTGHAAMCCACKLGACINTLRLPLLDGVTAEPTPPKHRHKKMTKLESKLAAARAELLGDIDAERPPSPGTLSKIIAQAERRKVRGMPACWCRAM